MNKINTIIKGTYGKERKYIEVDSLPTIGEEWNYPGYEDAYVKDVTCINDEVVETTSGDPKTEHDFYKVNILYNDDIFIEYVCVPKENKRCEQ